MATVDQLIGSEAADFRLPTADSREISLSECLSRGPAVVWFSRGLGCPMCRRHRAQLTLGYPSFQDLNAEILEITPTPVDRAAFYFSNYSLAFPYLCDPSRGTAQAYGIEQSPITLLDQAKWMVREPTGVPGLMREMGQGPTPLPEEKANWTVEDAFFIIEPSGVIRLARIGRLAGTPSRTEIEQTLRELAA